MTRGEPRLILASASPRRQELLAEAGYDFEVFAPAVYELHSAQLTLREVTSCNATRKGLAIARVRADEVVLAADTLVGLDGNLLGKPADLEEAAEFLRRLSGRTHEVVSGVFIIHFRERKSCAFTVLSRVTFRRLSDRMIAEYFTAIDPLDKAGGYAAQGKGGAIIDRIGGSRSNVIGLPIAETRAALARFGIR